VTAHIRSMEQNLLEQNSILIFIFVYLNKYVFSYSNIVLSYFTEYTYTSVCMPTLRCYDEYLRSSSTQALKELFWMNVSSDLNICDICLPLLWQYDRTVYTLLSV